MNNISSIKDYKNKKVDIDGLAGKRFSNTENGEYYNNKIASEIQNKGGISMDNEKLLEKYLDNSEQNRRDMEKRIMEDRRESEKRYEARINSLESKIDGLSNTMSSKIDGLETKIDNNNKFIINISIATILGIAAMVITVILR